MKDSVRFKINLALAIAILAILTIGMLVNTIFLGDYYLSGKKRDMVSTYNEINEAYENRDKIINGVISSMKNTPIMGGMLSGGEDIAEVETRLANAMQNSFDRISENRNMRILILEDSGNMSYNGSTGRLEKLYNIAFYSAPVGAANTQAEIIKDFRIAAGSNAESIIDTDNYDVFTTEDPSEEMSYLYLQGTLSNGNLLYARTSLQSIEDSVTISNRFFLYVSLAVLGGMMVVMYFLTKSFTAPILELSKLAEEMAEQKFDRQYTGTRTDEIGKMGQSMNYLSKSLEKSIGELKSANIKLQADLEKKEREEERRKAFISNVSHELKTPISLIQGYAEGLSENINDDQEGREFYCSVIIDEANKMSEMVKKLLDLNQLEAGDNTVVMEHLNVTALVGNILNNSNILFTQKGANLIFDDSVSVYAWGDAELVTEVFTNYMSNALNHVDGDMIIEVLIKDLKDRVRVSVFNTGDPIPEDEIDNIWDKFYKVDKARTREYGGSGVGLSIVKAAMDNMGRSYGVENKEDGVEFWFELDAQSYREEEDEGQEV